jgi:hypothetical protein
MLHEMTYDYYLRNPISSINKLKSQKLTLFFVKTKKTFRNSYLKEWKKVICSKCHDMEDN